MQNFVSVRYETFDLKLKLLMLLFVYDFKKNHKMVYFMQYENV